MVSRRPILIIDDDRIFREALVVQLQLEGNFSVEQAGSISQALNLLKEPTARYNALILDVTLPDGDGRDFCADQRRQGRRIPIIMLTGSIQEADVIRGLNAGANDYVTKPIRVAELQARIRAQIRIFENSDDAVFAIGTYTFQPSAKLLLETSGNRRIQLTEKEAAILSLLYRSGNRPVSRQVLLNEVWGYNSSVKTHTVETHIYRLRKKIEPEPARTCLLISEHGGYRLDPDGV